MSTEQWTTIIFRNGWQLHVPQTTINVIDQMAAASESALGAPSFVKLALRGDEYVSVNALETMAFVGRASADEANTLMPPRDAHGQIVSSVSPAND